MCGGGEDSKRHPDFKSPLLSGLSNGTLLLPGERERATEFYTSLKILFHVMFQQQLNSLPCSGRFVFGATDCSTHCHSRFTLSAINFIVDYLSVVSFICVSV